LIQNVIQLRKPSAPLSDNTLPFPYEIDTATQIIYAAVGPWTAAAVTRWVEELLADPAYVPGMRGMLNLRFAAGPVPNVDAMRDIAAALAPITSIRVRTRWAVLVGSPKMFDRIRLLETFTSGGFVQFRAFDDDHAAITWLGIESHRNPWLQRL
jgi:hypothetical protein